MNHEYTRMNTKKSCVFVSIRGSSVLLKVRDMVKKLTLLLACLMILTTTTADARPVRTGDLMAPFSLPGITGKRVSSSVYAGNVLVLYFWSDACGCREQLIALRPFIGSMKKRPLKFVGINVAQDARRVSAFVASHALPYEVLLDETSELSRERFGVRVLPTVLVISRDGVLREKLVGVIETRKLIAIIKGYL